jgi:hypothetical protein
VISAQPRAGDGYNEPVVRVVYAAIALLAGCSFLIDVPDRLPDERAKWSCARSGTCCPDTRWFPPADTVGAAGLGVLGMATSALCAGHACSTDAKVNLVYLPFLGAATYTIAAIYGLRANGRCERLQHEAAVQLGVEP